MPEQLARQAVTHSSWTEHRPDSYERLAFLGDSVLSLSITTLLIDAGEYTPGQLTKIRAQTVSGRACRAVAVRLGLPERMKAAAPETGAGLAADALLQTERVVAEMTEAVIGACFLHYGYLATAAAVVDAFAPEVDIALTQPADFKSALQERLARRGEIVVYQVLAEHGPPHDRTFEIAAMVDGRELARGSGRSKKDAEQEAARAAMGALDLA